MAKKRLKKWIQATGLKRGALTKEAKAAGFSTWQGYCAQSKDKLSTKAQRRCNLAQRLSGMSKARAAKRKKGK
jgi:hypothetical protein